LPGISGSTTWAFARWKGFPARTASIGSIRGNTAVQYADGVKAAPAWSWINEHSNPASPRSSLEIILGLRVARRKTDANLADPARRKVEQSINIVVILPALIGQPGGNEKGVIPERITPLILAEMDERMVL
jgi:hypothetical protein